MKNIISINADEVADELENSMYELVDRQMEEDILNCIHRVAPELDMSLISVNSDLKNKSELTIEGLEDEEIIDKAIDLYKSERQ